MNSKENCHIIINNNGHFANVYARRGKKKKKQNKKCACCMKFMVDLSTNQFTNHEKRYSR